MGHFDTGLSVNRGDRVDLHRFIFVVMPGFSALDLGAGIDSLAAANTALGKPVFHWHIVSEGGDPIRSSSGMTVAVEGDLPEARRDDCIVVCGPLDAQQHPPSKKITGWLRQAARLGSRLCGLGGGALFLARAGLAGEGRISTHWRLQPIFEESFLKLDSVCTVYEAEASVASCGGGAATLDLFSALIRQKAGAEASNQVADHLLCASMRPGNSRQTMTDACRLQHRNKKLSKAVAIIKDCLDNPLPTSLIADQAGLSTRQLERLFARYMGSSPKNYMTELRLERARTLLQQTDMRVIDVAIACGFSSASHFSKLYRKQFGLSPHVEQNGP
ncbi:GlxA family transcriptional regulator [Ruegeria arenilitoris]|uniref:GlxA family transcriptional regulator n=1 Tax=Ruegeria arenilitoris TaxID=1173585 RepID=UPI00147CB524